MAKFMWILVITVAFAACINALSGECPLSSKMTTCTPVCKQDIDCATSGGVCCPNLCNTKSCVRPLTGSQGSVGGAYKGSKQDTATGVYCGNVKCNPYEKCGLDKSTKRQKCVRT